MIDKEKVFWQFLRDLRYLGDDVKGQMVYGGCSWREPSPIPDAVERLKELDWEDIDDSLASVLCNEIAKTKLKNKVAELFNYHEWGLDLDYSTDEKERLYAGWLNRFILICAEAGMADMFEEKDTTDSGNEPQRYTDGLLAFFRGNVDLIEELKQKDRSKVAWMVTRWSKEGKCKNIVDFGKIRIAKLLIENGIVEQKRSDFDKDVDSFRKKF